jgi:hypothetical protein
LTNSQRKVNEINNRTLKVSTTANGVFCAEWLFVREGHARPHPTLDWANKIVQQPLRIVDGCAMVTDQPGNGLT